MGAGRKITCARCGDVIQSMHVHDFKYCECGAIAVDGGSDYLRLIGNREDIVEFNEKPKKKRKKNDKKHSIINRILRSLKRICNMG